MVLLANVRFLVLVAVLSFSAAAQQLIEGQQLQAQGRYSEARDIYTAALRDLGAAPSDIRLKAILLDSLGVTETCLQDYSAAEEALNHALVTYQTLGADDTVSRRAIRHLAELYMVERRPAEAATLLHQVVAAVSGGIPPDNIALAIAYSDLSLTSGMQKKWAEAETEQRQALQLFEGELRPDDPLLLSTLNPLAVVLFVEHRYAEAVAQAERAWHIVQSSTTPIAPGDRASVLDILSRAYAHDGRVAEAESCARQAVDTIETAYGHNHPWLVGYLVHYSDVLKQAGRKRQAKEIQQRANALLAQKQQNPSAYTVSVNALRTLR